VLLLVAVSAGEGLAASSEEAPAAPSEEQLAEAIAEEEAAEANRDEWLTSPQAANEREASEYAYTELTAPEEEELLKSSFVPQLGQLESDPARLLSHVQLDQVFSQNEAQVTLEGEKMLLESSIPIRVSEEGDLRKVDLGLDETENGYAPANPIVDLSLPETAAGPIQVGESGLAISIEGASPGSSVRRFDEGDLFLPEVHKDSSVLLSPIAGGVDISTLLLSRESPEQLPLGVTLPAGAVLRPSENGGAEVLAGDGNLLTNVNPPRAVDAQGTEVPTTLSVEGESLVVGVPHRSMDVAYPILVDPEVVENWSGWSDPSALGYWKWQWAGVAEKDYIGQTSCIVTCWGSGLYVRSRSSFTYPAGSFGRWWFTVQGSTTYMWRVVLGPMNFDAHGCTAQEPHAYTGVWNDGGRWAVLTNAYPSGWFSYIDSGSGQNLGQGTRTAFVGIQAAWNTNIKCGRDYALGGATLYLTDPESPTVTSVTGLPSGWVKGNTQITATVTANDPGLGVQKIRALGGPGGEWWWNQSSCAGTMKELCAATRSGQISFNTNGLWEGKGTVNFQPYDPVGNANNSKAYEVWVDRLPPTIDLEGQLAKATKEEGGKEVPAGEGDELSLPTYNLKVEASDATSGAKAVELFLDESKSPEVTEAPECSSGKCSLTYQLRLAGLKAGPHDLRVIAGDQAGNTTERKVEFEYTPATGIKDEYVMQYIPLPDGLDHSEESESHGPEIAVNVINGNVVYHERDVQEEGRDANLELERSYNSQLPSEKDTRWGHGWSVAQLPELESQPAEPTPTKATMLRTSGALTSAVSIPTSTSQPPTFDAKLHALVEKLTSGGYSVSYEDREEENVFDAAGELEETAYPSGAALKIDYKGEYKYATPAYSSSFGSAGAGDGQLRAPGDLALDAKGNIWLVDQGNNRVEKFDSKGNFLSKFGSYGSGAGQLHMPSAITIDSSGNLWIADTENSRIEEFGPDGKYLSQFGSVGTGNGQLGRPEGLAIDSKGNIWVADTYNSRIQEFSGTGTFIKSFGSYGTGKGQFYNPTGIDFGAGDTLWVTDWSNNRVTELSSSGEVLREFGSKGSGIGQFEHPDAVEADGTGRVWVADEGNNRIEAFSESGAYITQFGTKGAEAGQFNFGFPIGVAGDGKGHLWVSDPKNNRLQKWTIGEFIHGEEITGMTVEEPDPWTSTDISAEFKTAKGLVEAVDVEAGPESSYGYESGLLTTERDSEGETHYGYDSSKRLALIQLPNGTVASIEYDSLSRATAVTVDPAGEEGPKTTKFVYVDEPRETRVSGGGNPEVIYSIGNDGSVFKWNYAKEPPRFASLGGTLWEHRNSTIALTAGDQSFSATAESAHQIKEVQVLINGEIAAEEKACEDDPKTEQHECQQVTLEWVTNTANHPAGQLNLEVVATDFLEDSVAEKFFVTIPQQPESEEEAPVEPTFEDVKKFREEFGLDYESGRSEAEINKLIFELLEDWKLERPIARWSAEEWGVPMREKEVKEMEYRDKYIAHDGVVISEWAEAHEPATYAGYYVDNRHGGLIHVGFTASQAQAVEQLKLAPEIEAVDRITAFPIPPGHSMASLSQLQVSIGTADAVEKPLRGLITKVGIDVEGNLVTVGALDVSAVDTQLTEKYGPNLLSIRQDTQPEGIQSRLIDSNPLKAGQAIGYYNAATGLDRECTAGFGAAEKVGTKANGQAREIYFVLTSGHCFEEGEIIKRFHSSADTSPKRFGMVKRRSLFHKQDGFETDAEAIRLDDAALVPRVIYKAAGRTIPVTGIAQAVPGMPVCLSAEKTNRVVHGKVTGPAEINPAYGEISGEPGPFWQVPMTLDGHKGDSGGPVWQCSSHKAVALHTFLVHTGESLETPLLAPPLPSTIDAKRDQAPGVLQAPTMGHLHVVKAR
jgi:sugar lactone lactonase YvrE